jgi:hypothetical protein
VKAQDNRNSKEEQSPPPKLNTSVEECRDN